MVGMEGKNQQEQIAGHSLPFLSRSFLRETCAGLLPLALRAPHLPVVHAVDFAALFNVAQLLAQTTAEGRAHRAGEPVGREVPRTRRRLRSGSLKRKEERKLVYCPFGRLTPPPTISHLPIPSPTSNPVACWCAARGSACGRPGRRRRTWRRGRRYCRKKPTGRSGAGAGRQTPRRCDPTRPSRACVGGGGGGAP